MLNAVLFCGTLVSWTLLVMGFPFMGLPNQLLFFWITSGLFSAGMATFANVAMLTNGVQDFDLPRTDRGLLMTMIGGPFYLGICIIIKSSAGFRVLCAGMLAVSALAPVLLPEKFMFWMCIVADLVLLLGVLVVHFYYRH